MLNKLDILQSIRCFLYDDLEVRLTQDLNVIYEDQSKLVPMSELGFYYKGNQYRRYGHVKPVYRSRYRTLHTSLHLAMDEYMKKCKAFNEEWDVIASYIRCVLNQCSNYWQLYSYLPTGLHEFLKSIGCPYRIQASEDIDIGNNQQGKELLLTRLMLNMTGD